MRTPAPRPPQPRRLSAVVPICLGTALVLVPAAARVTGQAPAAAPVANPLLRILSDELQRNVEGLKREPVPPYFASYTVYDVQSASVRASFGALTSSGSNRSRSAVIDVRVGDSEVAHGARLAHQPRGPALGGALVEHQKKAARRADGDGQAHQDTLRIAAPEQIGAAARPVGWHAHGDFGTAGHLRQGRQGLAGADVHQLGQGRGAYLAEAKRCRRRHHARTPLTPPKPPSDATPW